MTARKVRTTPQVHENDLKLAPETVKDLEPGEQRTGAVKGGGVSRTCNGGSNMT